MGLEDAKKAAEQIMKIRKPRGLAARDEMHSEVDSLMNDIEAYHQELSDHIEGLRELITELEDAERGSLSDLTINIRGGAEQVRDLLT